MSAGVPFTRYLASFKCLIDLRNVLFGQFHVAYFPIFDDMIDLVARTGTDVGLPSFSDRLKTQARASQAVVHIIF